MTTTRQPQTNHRLSQPDYQAIREAVNDAIQPFVERLSKLESLHDQADAVYYRKDVLNPALEEIRTSVNNVKDDIKAQREFFYKAVIVAGAALSFIVLLAQHVSIK